MSVDAIHDIHVILQDLQRRIMVLEIAVKVRAEDVAHAIEGDKWPKKTPKSL